MDETQRADFSPVRPKAHGDYGIIDLKRGNKLFPVVKSHGAVRGADQETLERL
jgi:hypothetical protein